MTYIYEVLFILKPNEEKPEEKISMVEEIITTNNGNIKKTGNWGIKKLAYEIAGFNEGLYVLIEFKADSKCTKELDHKLKIDDSVIRHMLIRKEY